MVRLVVPYALLALVISSIAIADRSFLYATALIAQAVFYALAVYGAWLERRDRIVGGRAAALAAAWPTASSREPPGGLNASIILRPAGYRRAGRPDRAYVRGH